VARCIVVPLQFPGTVSSVLCPRGGCRGHTVILSGSRTRGAGEVAMRFMGRGLVIVIVVVVVVAAVSVGISGLKADDDVAIGERPAIEVHLDQARIESGAVSLKECFRRGRILFEAVFNKLDGQGRPLSTGASTIGGTARLPGQPAFIRTSGPDSNSCACCHAQPRSGGGRDFGGNVFGLAQN